MPGLRWGKGNNINGPTLMKVPKWIEDPLGKYYLYFAHHGGKYIRLAYSESIRGPYEIYKPGTLTNKIEFLKHHHIASPEIWIDREKNIIRMYFHANIRGKGIYKDQGQMTYLASSKDGIHFQPRSEQLAPFYLRVFRHQGYFYGIAKNDNLDALLVRSKDGLSEFERGHSFMLHYRHGAFLKEEDVVYVFFTKAFDKPERILVSKMRLEPDWTKWSLSKPKIVLEPEKKWEGANYPLTQSKYGGTKPARALRDPFVFKEKDTLFLFYTVKGENGIALAELTHKQA
ncbi:MAG: hypothetical protein GF364_17155 [Candidatus Lokiarchaeota archaeon]|nr:hypothetical protein [Candidatus Lokiarchaeota archaeon]